MTGWMWVVLGVVAAVVAGLGWRAARQLSRRFDQVDRGIALLRAGARNDALVAAAPPVLSLETLEKQLLGVQTLLGELDRAVAELPARCQKPLSELQWGILFVGTGKDDRTPYVRSVGGWGPLGKLETVELEVDRPLFGGAMAVAWGAARITSSRLGVLAREHGEGVPFVGFAQPLGVARVVLTVKLWA